MLSHTRSGRCMHGVCRSTVIDKRMTIYATYSFQYGIIVKAALEW